MRNVLFIQDLSHGGPNVDPKANPSPRGAQARVFTERMNVPCEIYRSRRLCRWCGSSRIAVKPAGTALRKSSKPVWPGRSRSFPRRNRSPALSPCGLESSLPRWKFDTRLSAPDVRVENQGPHGKSPLSRYFKYKTGQALVQECPRDGSGNPTRRGPFGPPRTAASWRQDGRQSAGHPADGRVRRQPRWHARRADDSPLPPVRIGRRQADLGRSLRGRPGGASQPASTSDRRVDRGEPRATGHGLPSKHTERLAAATTTSWSACN